MPSKRPASRATTGSGAKRARINSTNCKDGNAPKTDTKPKSNARGLDTNLPPAGSLPIIFKSIALKALKLGFTQVLSHLKERPLRVATMCSGTDSPVLALNMLLPVLATLGHKLEIQHVFSAEIVPFKQAFLQRNFRPPVLFRDVEKMKGAQKAETAFGGPRDIPSKVHILVAGFACVDFSNLNRKTKLLAKWTTSVNGKAQGDKSQIEYVPTRSEREDWEKEGAWEVGESGGTFFAILDYADDHRPALVILENVVSAPWKSLTKFWEGIGYAAAYVKVDTKDYYLPCTRERVYLLAINLKHTEITNQQAKEILEDWKSIIQAFKRRASSPVDSFLFHSSDPDARKALNSLQSESSRLDVQWAKSEKRHLNIRRDAKLGPQTPFTNWSSGVPLPPDYTMRRWFQTQPDRVNDMLDIIHLIHLERGIDIRTKSYIIDVSQNVDRKHSLNQPGITGCITPCGIPFDTFRGRQLTGLESLVLQGMMKEMLTLSGESQRELQDLAGNAMSTTVVGSAILAALIAAKEAIHEGYFQGVDSARKAPTVSCSWTGQLQRASASDLKGGLLPKVELEALLKHSMASARWCFCEDHYGEPKGNPLICRDCESTACTSCAGNPEHNYLPIERPMETPASFQAIVRARLPDGLSISLEPELFENAKMSLSADKVAADDWELFAKLLKKALPVAELTFTSTTRSTWWTVSYSSQWTCLSLVLQPGHVRWELYLVPCSQEPVNARIRELLQRPVAMMSIDKDIFQGSWEICLPVTTSFTMFIIPSLDQYPTLRASSGLEEHANETLPAYLDLDVKNPLVPGISHLPDITGTWNLRRYCGTAMNTLYVKSDNPGSALYLFRESNPLAAAGEDSFVIAHDCRRLDIGESRKICLRIGESSASGNEPNFGQWRPRACRVPGSDSATAYIDGVWFSPGAPIVLRRHEPIINLSIVNLQTPETKLEPSPCPLDCSRTMLDMAACTFEWIGNLPPGCVPDVTYHFDEVRGKFIFASAPVVVSKLQRSLLAVPSEIFISTADKAYRCKDCTPLRPAVKWIWQPAKRSVSKRMQRQQKDEAEDGDETNELETREDLIAPECTEELEDLELLVEGQEILNKQQEKATDMDIGSGQTEKVKMELVAFEDPAACATYEKALESRAQCVDVVFSINENSMASLRVCANFRALAHRALAQLNDINAISQGTVHFSIDPLFVDITDTSRKRDFVLLDNSLDGKTECKIDGTDKKTKLPCKLRLAQKQSLTWLIAIEEGKEANFVERQVVECHVAGLGWMLRAHASRDHQVRGGLIADHVGYGKTVVCIALIKARLGAARPISMPLPKQKAHRIELRATLVVVPPTLIRQWKDELATFWEECNVVSIIGNSALKAVTISKLVEADVVIVSHNLLTDEGYHRRLCELAGLPSWKRLPDHRALYQWMQKIQEGLEQTLKDITSSLGLALYGETLRRRIREAESDELETEIMPSARLKGARYAEKRRKDRNQEERYHDSVQDPRTIPVAGFAECQTYLDFKHPVLEMFDFARKITDEFHYLDARKLVCLMHIHAPYVWLLSGTPNLHTFADVNRVSQLIGSPLNDTEGFDRDELSSRQQGRLYTDLEKFESALAPRTNHWNQMRLDSAQDFLNVVARQNEAPEHDFKTEYHAVISSLSWQHEGIYHEIEARTYDASASNVNVVRLLADGQGNDRASRMSAFTKDMGPTKKVVQALSRLVASPNLPTDLREVRDKQKTDILAALLSEMRLIYAHIESSNEGYQNSLQKLEESFAHQLRQDLELQNEVGHRIKAAREDIRKVMEHAVTYERAGDGTEMKIDPQEKVISALKEYCHCSSDAEWNRPPKVLSLIRTAVEICKAERYLKNIYSISETQSKRLDCGAHTSAALALAYSMDKNSGSVPVSVGNESIMSKIYILADCGHSVCQDCLANADFPGAVHGSGQTSSRPQTCPSNHALPLPEAGMVSKPVCMSQLCPVPGCNGVVSPELLVDMLPWNGDKERPPHNDDQDSRIQAVLDTVLQIPKADKILVFSHFDELSLRLGHALISRDIPTSVCISATKHGNTIRTNDENSKVIEAFKKNKPVVIRADGERENKQPARVLVLPLGSHAAAGHNMEMANHVIFATPVLSSANGDVPSQYRQALGRCRRYGQEKTVHVYFCAALRTVEVNLWEQLLKRRLVFRDGTDATEKWSFEEEDPEDLLQKTQYWGTGRAKEVCAKVLTQNH